MTVRFENLIEYKSNQPTIANPGNSQVLGPKIFTYKTTEDTVATVSSGTYFGNTSVTSPAVALLVPDILPGDIVYCYCSDGPVTLMFSAKAPSFTTQVLSRQTVFADQLTPAAGSAIVAVNIPGLLATDLVFTQIVDDGSNNVYVIKAAATADTLTITFDKDPLGDAIVNYLIVR